MSKNDSQADIRKLLKEQSEEIKRHMGPLLEHFDDKIGAVAELVTSTNDNIEIIKTDIEFIKSDLRRKVIYDEFAALEQRVATPESKVRK